MLSLLNSSADYLYCSSLSEAAHSFQRLRFEETKCLMRFVGKSRGTISIERCSLDEWILNWVYWEFRSRNKETVMLASLLSHLGSVPLSSRGVQSLTGTLLTGWYNHPDELACSAKEFKNRPSWKISCCCTLVLDSVHGWGMGLEEGDVVHELAVPLAGKCGDSKLLLEHRGSSWFSIRTNCKAGNENSNECAFPSRLSSLLHSQRHGHSFSPYWSNARASVHSGSIRNIYFSVAVSINLFWCDTSKCSLKYVNEQRLMLQEVGLRGTGGWRRW